MIDENFKTNTLIIKSKEIKNFENKNNILIITKLLFHTSINK